MAATVRPAAIQQAVREMFERVAERLDDACRFKVGLTLAREVGYPGDVLDAVPQHSAEAFTGLAYLHPLKPAISSRAVGPSGSVHSRT
jgi:hypothetical protein